MAKRKDFLLGEALIKRGMVTQAQVDEALKEKNHSGEYIGQILIRLGYLQEGQLMEVLSDQLGVSYVKDLRNLSIAPSVLEKVPAKLVSHYHFLPLDLKGNTLTICVSNPLDFHIFDEIGALVGYEIEIKMSDSKGIEEAVKEHYGIAAGVLDKLRSQEDEAVTPRLVSIESIDTAGEDGSIIELVNQLLIEAQKSGASDIHLEPFQDDFEIRYRIDGILQTAKVPTQIKRFRTNIISRIKIMAGLDIAEKRLPQDGRILARTKSGELDLRVSVIPSSHGEAVMVRMLRPGMLIDLKKLGFSADALKTIQHAIKKPNGIILVTGPTGSGKTTTLYACLKRLNTPEQKIITIEDPIEYEMRGILQIQVQPKIGLTFATCLRHALRHDPDIMMVGEIRDTETAQIASRAALTGHLVFSTLHTRDATSAITRLIDMGVEPFLVASSVEVVIAQRLVRMVCQDCKYEIGEDKKEIYDHLPSRYRNFRFSQGKGCLKCRKTGYSGRVGIQEILVVDDELRKLVVKQVPTTALHELTLKKGMRTLWEDGIEKAVQGLTTVDEVFRVAGREP